METQMVANNNIQTGIDTLDALIKKCIPSTDIPYPNLIDNIIVNHVISWYSLYSEPSLEQIIINRLSTDNSFGVIVGDLFLFDSVADLMDYPIFSAIKASKHPDVCKGLTKFAVYQRDITPAMKRQIYENLYAVAKEELVIVEIY